MLVVLKIKYCKKVKYKLIILSLAPLTFPSFFLIPCFAYVISNSFLKLNLPDIKSILRNILNKSLIPLLLMPIARQGAAVALLYAPLFLL